MINLKRGYDLPQQKRRPGVVPIISSSGQSGVHDEAKVSAPGVVTGRYGTIGEVFLIQEDFWPLNTALYVQDFRGNAPAYVAALLKTINWRAHNGKSGVPGINRNDVHEDLVDVPGFVEQHAIVSVLGALDDKVESNRRVSASIRGMARGSYDSAVAIDSKCVMAGDHVDFHNRLRRPLSAAERLEMPGDVPYYGATGVFDHVRDALFDGILLLIGEDGSVVCSDGTPVVQYIWGRAWVNNHAHVLTGRAISTELALVMLERADIRPWVTGAVQAKLSMRSLKQVEVTMPGVSVRPPLEKELAKLFGMYRGLMDETRTLTAIRDALLPKLVSGQIRIPPTRDEQEAVETVVAELDARRPSARNG